MSKQVVTLSGFKELERRLSNLPKATGKNVLRRIGKGALEPMADLASQKAPYRSGRLSFSIIVSEKRTRRVKPSTTKWVKGKFRADPSTGISMAMGPASGLGVLTYASYDEFGTIDTPAFAYMRGAWDILKMSSLEYIKDNLWKQIERSEGKLARKAAKAAAL